MVEEENMNETTVCPTVFVSYAHESTKHQQKVRRLCDILRTNYGIDATADFYEEDNPAGGLLTDFMQSMLEKDKIICILSAAYKQKTDEGVGGVAYEGAIITDILYRKINSSKIIPIVIDAELDLEDCTPHFLMKNRKAILRSSYGSDEDFYEEIARAVHYLPRNPKPLVGKNRLLFRGRLTADIDNLDIKTNIQDYQSLFNNALYFAKKNEVMNFQKLFNKVKKHVFQNLNEYRMRYENDFQAKTNQDLPPIMDEFIRVSAPVLLIPFAGYLSSHEKFNRQQGLLFDLMALDGWWQKDGRHREVILHVPELLTYVYHHLYGALHVINDDIKNITSIFQYKIPVDQPGNKYDYLYKALSVTGYVKSLGRNCFESFNFILTAYQRWDWLKLMFDDERDYTFALTSYQMAINLMFYFHSVKDKTLNTFSDILAVPVIPPSFSMADSKVLQRCNHFIIKNAEFFKDYFLNLGVTENQVMEGWETYTSIMYRFTAEREC